jgi:hypothetical protein
MRRALEPSCTLPPAIAVGISNHRAVDQAVTVDVAVDVDFHFAGLPAGIGVDGIEYSGTVGKNTSVYL